MWQTLHFIHCTVNLQFEIRQFIVRGVAQPVLGRRKFLFTTAPKPAVASHNLRMNEYQEAFSRRYSRPKRDENHLPSSHNEVWNMQNHVAETQGQLRRY
jgi:hypothetical protein